MEGIVKTEVGLQCVAARWARRSFNKTSDLSEQSPVSIWQSAERSGGGLMSWTSVDQCAVTDNTARQNIVLLHISTSSFVCLNLMVFISTLFHLMSSLSHSVFLSLAASFSTLNHVVFAKLV